MILGGSAWESNPKYLKDVTRRRRTPIRRFAPRTGRLSRLSTSSLILASTRKCASVLETVWRRLSTTIRRRTGSTCRAGEPDRIYGIVETGLEPATPWSRTGPSRIPRRVFIWHRGASSAKDWRARSASLDTVTFNPPVEMPFGAPVVRELPPDPGPPERLLTVRDVARRLGVSSALVYKLCQQTLIRGLQISGALRFQLRAISAYLLGTDRGDGELRVEHFASC